MRNGTNAPLCLTDGVSPGTQGFPVPRKRARVYASRVGRGDRQRREEEDT